MSIDDSFKKPGAIPFKWEIRPGVPKLHHQQEVQQSPSHNLRPTMLQHQYSLQKHHYSINHHRSKLLSPPPSGFYFRPPPPPPPPEPRVSTPRTRPDPPDIVDSSRRCFPSPWVRRKDDDKKRSGRRRRTKPESTDFEPDFTSDLETLSRWSGSTRKSVSLFRDSSSPLSSSSFSSYQSSPPPVTDAELAWLGLF